MIHSNSSTNILMPGSDLGTWCTQPQVIFPTTRGRYCDSHSTQDPTRIHRGWAPCLQLSQPWLEISVTVPTPHTPVTKRGVVFLREVTPAQIISLDAFLWEISHPQIHPFFISWPPRTEDMKKERGNKVDRYQGQRGRWWGGNFRFYLKINK